MRNTDISGYLTWTSRLTLMRGLRLAFVAAGIGLVMSAGPVRAGDDDDDDDGMTFEERIIDNLMSGLGAKSATSKGIEYRERSPLVVPPKLDLPPPASATQANAPNWPKDPDVARRKAAIEARKKEVKKKEPWQEGQPLTPAEIEAGRKQQTATESSKEPLEPGVAKNPSLMPEQLGYKGGLLGIFKGNSAESAPFKGEPPRESLTEPPVGYQTPSSNFAYGTGPQKPLVKEGQYDTMTGKPIQ
ncbi:hypothetical protein [Bradyrhizobium genosp. P]|uniref:hypothetical protein n=1 Tax=Bradyrhizobium genosp. P TaxID=83641 RepID=UPI003CEADB4D